MQKVINEKPHYLILDGLRGIAAIVVVAFHIFEAHTPDRFGQIINHGYLAVDFFFLLSGYVIGYAYDDRWGQISIWDFFKRRVIRLQPMLIFGTIIGALCFYYQDSVTWPNISEVPVWQVVLMMIIGATLIPVPPSMDIRGWAEMHPLNGPAWSLFFEYVANILYAIGVRRFSTTALSVLVAIAACALINLTVFGPNGDVIGGWSLAPQQFFIGLTRVMFPFFAGLLLCRMTKPKYIPNAFFICSVLVVIFLSLPRFGGEESLWLNGLYESLTIIVAFPVIIYLGAGGTVDNHFTRKLCKFFGDISYPVYITHYPIVYIYTGWVHDHKYKIEDVALTAVLTFFACIALAYVSLKLYDEPVRKWLGVRMLTRRP